MNSLRFSEAKIYKILDVNKNIIYVGSTCQALYQRFKSHNHNHEGNTIELIKNFPCDNFTELRIEENKYINLYPNLLNKNRAHITEEDNKVWRVKYYRDHRDKKNEYQLDLYQKKKPEKKKYQLDRYYNKEHYEKLKAYSRKRYWDKKKLLENNKLLENQKVVV